MAHFLENMLSLGCGKAIESKTVKLETAYFPPC